MTGRTRLALASALLLIASGCAKVDPRVKALGVGIPKDSALAVMELSPTDLGEAYLIDGQYIEAYVVRMPGVEGPRDSLSRDQLTPVVVIDGKVTGWGWAHWDSVAGLKKIAVKPEQ
jgi:hypothetical protein